MGLFINVKRTVDWLLGSLIGIAIGTILLVLVIRFFGSTAWVIANMLIAVCIIVIATWIGKINPNLKALHRQSVVDVTALTLSTCAIIAVTAHSLATTIVIIIGGSTSIFISEFLMKRTKQAIKGSSNK